MKFSIVFDQTPKAIEYFEQLHNLYEFEKNPEQADVIVVLGGDGFMLQTLHKYQALNKPFYGINCGTLGFLMNKQKDALKNLQHCIAHAKTTILHPLKMTAITLEREEKTFYAINEVSLLRQTPHASKIKIEINNKVQLSELVGDGLIVATPAGSTAYNYSARGPIIPLGVPLLALTPLNSFRPKHWRGALIPHAASFTFTILDPHYRCVHAMADFDIVEKVSSVHVYQDFLLEYKLLFDKKNNLEERIIKEQFSN